MEDCKIPNRALNCNLGSINSKPGRPRKNWQDIIRRDLNYTGLSWDDASELAHSRCSWRQRVAQCPRHEMSSGLTSNAAEYAVWIPQSTEKSLSGCDSAPDSLTLASDLRRQNSTDPLAAFRQRAHCISFNSLFYTCTHAHTHPFNGPFSGDYPGEPVPER